MSDKLSSAFKNASSSSPASVSLFKELGRVYLATVSAFADIDSDIIAANDNLISEGIVPSERKVSLESAMFAANNFALMCGMLITNYDNFVEFLTDAIDDETELDGLSESDIANARKETAVQDFPEVSHYMEIGITVFSDSVSMRLHNSMTRGFAVCSLSNLPDAVNTAMESFKSEDRQILGMILANYIYIIKALNNNQKFFKKLNDRVAAAEKAFDIKKQ